MQRHLYFICPTDYLETIINDTFISDNYYLTSLGNSMTFSRSTIEQLKLLIASKRINNISFILADNNQIVTNVLAKQSVDLVHDLHAFQHEITSQEKRAVKMWQMQNYQIPVLSYYLTLKVDQLKYQLSNSTLNQVEIDAKIYYRDQDIFNEVSSDLVYHQQFSLN